MITSLLAYAAIAGHRYPTDIQPATIITQNAVGMTVDAKDGETISGVKNFKVLVQTTEVVTQVEFYVNGELRSTEQSTPYRFEFDTLNESDGTVKVKFIAYTDQTHKATKEFSLTVDNGMSKGVDFHVKAGYDFMRVSKFDEAIAQGRIALKIDKKSDAARLLLARTYLFQGTLDKAQKYAEDVTSDNPKNLEAQQVLSVISLKQAFRASAKSPDDTSVLESMRSALKSAIDARHAYLDGAVDALGAPNDSNVLAVADANSQAGHYTTAIGLLSPLVAKKPGDPAVLNRLVYAQIRRGRYADASTTLELAKKASGAFSDPYTLALSALLYSQAGNSKAADADMQNAVLGDQNNFGVRTAQASMALRNLTPTGSTSSTSALENILNTLRSDASNRTEVNYFLSALSNRLNRFNDADKFFQDSVLEEPCNYDMYIEAGNASIAEGQIFIKYDTKHKLIALTDDETKKQHSHYVHAELMFQTALLAKPDSQQALAGLALAEILLGKTAGGLKYADAAVLTEPTYAAGLYIYSAALNAAGRFDDADKLARQAGKYDTELDGRGTPTPSTAWRYFNTRGRTPVITPPGV